jgi:hypothetical protein
MQGMGTRKRKEIYKNSAFSGVAPQPSAKATGDCFSSGTDWDWRERRGYAVRPALVRRAWVRKCLIVLVPDRRLVLIDSVDALAILYGDVANAAAGIRKTLS